MSEQVSPATKKKPGRPALPKKQVLGTFIKFRVREPELAELRKRAKRAGLTVAAYLREKGLAS